MLLLLAGAAALVVGFWLVVRLRSLGVLLLISFLLSFALEPPVDLLARRGWRQGLGTAAVFVAIVVAVVLFAGALGSLLVAQVGDLVDAIPGYAQQVTTFLNDRLGTSLSGGELADQLRGNQGIRDFVNGLAAGAVGLSTTLVGLVLQGLTVGLFTFYLVADGPRLRRAVCSVLPPGRQAVALRVWELAIDSTGGYVYSRVLLAACSAVATTVFLTVAGVPYPLALGLWVGLVSQFVPTVGTYLAGALPVLIALLDDPVSALWVLVFIVVYQQFENMVLSPRITARTMALHPAVAFGAVIAGGAIMGPIGALLALPAAACVQALVVHLSPPLRGHRRPADQHAGPGEEGPMNREQRLEMLGRLAEVPSVELKMNIPADQRLALAGLELDAMRGRLREVYFFDTPDLTLYRNGLVTRARRTQGDDDDTVVKLRPAEPAALPRAVRDSPNLKVEMDVTRGAYVVSASLKGARKAGAVRRAVAGERSLERLFTKEQRRFFADHAPAGVGWDDLVALGPVLVVLLKWVPRELSNRTTIEQWHYPGQVPLVELSTKATPQTVLEVYAAGLKFVQNHGRSATGSQEPKTRKALEFFARTHPSR